MRILSCCAIASIAFLVTSTSQAESVADFYKGKNVELRIGYSSGGGYDTYARLLARHMGKYIPGNPTIVPRNMPGAGSLALANWLYNVAPRDGLAFGTIGRGTGFEPLLGNAAAKFHATEYSWLGSMNNEVSTCISWHTSGITKFEQLLQRELVVGGTGPAADTDVYVKVLNAVLGTKFKLISGYPGGSDISLAMERSEIQGRCGWSWSSMSATRMDWLESKKIHILVQLSLKKHDALGDAPLVVDLARNAEQRQVLTLIFARQALGRPFLAPPAIPHNRVVALQKAFMDTMKDKQFLQEADKGNIEINAISGEEVLEIVANAANTDPKILKKVAAILKVEKTQERKGKK